MPFPIFAGSWNIAALKQPAYFLSTM